MCYGEYDVLKLMSENSFITDVNYTDFAGKTINYTAKLNNAQYALGLLKKVANTSNNINLNEGIIWDGTYDIWDGVYDLGF